MSDPHTTPRTSSAPPISAPPMKSKIGSYELPCYDGTKPSKSHDSITIKLSPQTPMVCAPTGWFPSSQRWTVLVQGSEIALCEMRQPIFFNYCLVHWNTFSFRKPSRNTQNKWSCLAMGPYSSDPANHPWLFDR